MRSTRKRRRASSGSAPPPPAEEDDIGSRSAKEADIWDAFCEEYVESVEQLPLSIHRNFTLLKELDTQFNSLESTLPQNIEDYVQRRRNAMRQENSPKDNEEPPVSGKLLSDISTQVYELCHAAEDKVNLAQATYDAVDRHVRLLDQAISEHEVHSKIDLSVASVNSPTFPVSGLLMTQLKNNAEGAVVTTRASSQRQPERNSRPRVSTRPRRLLNPVALSGSMNSDGLSIEEAKVGDMPIDPNEPRYCYCGGYAYGEMIACDAANCEREWFHLGCVGLTEAPKRGKWFCNACKESNRAGTRRR